MPKDVQQVELLQVSNLEDYEWPESDPHAVPQRTRRMDNLDLLLVRQCATSAEVNLEAFLKDARQKKLDNVQTILNLLSHEKFQMNPVKGVRGDPRWREIVQDAVAEETPIEVVYPQGCVIPVAPKRYTNVGAAAGEDCMIEFFKLIDRQVRDLHAPGVRFHLLADASLYATAFQTHQTEVDAYYESLQDRIRALDASEVVHLHDYAELLTTRCRRDYQRSYYGIGRQVWAGDPASFIPNTDVPTLWRSVRCSVNTRRFQLSHADHLQLFGPREKRNEKHPYHERIEVLTDFAFREVITIRLACTAVDIPTRLWPEAIRASCHKGPKGERWPIGLRPYPEYYGSCKLLPYHGMPLISRNSKGKPKLEIVPEVLLRCRDDLIRVTADGEDEVYTYVAEDIESETRGADLPYARPYGMRAGEPYGDQRA